MLRPEQMSKLSVTGSKSVMDEVIETMHELNVVHITDYDGSWEGFEPGSSLEGADETSSTLVTVRAIESILDVTDEDVGAIELDLEEAEERLEEVRTEVNALDDERDELRGRRREIEDRLDQMELFATLGIDLDLLWGYDSLEVAVGEGDAGQIETALAEADGIDAFEVFGGRNSAAVFAREDEPGAFEEAMVGVPFSAVEVPEESGDPVSKVRELENELAQVETKLESVENSLELLRKEHAGFLLALEELLSIDAQKYEAPLRFATTERSFIVEGWLPSEEYDSFEQALRDAVGGRVEIDEIERARYTSGRHVHREVHDGDHGDGDATAAADADTQPEREQAVADGGTTAKAAGSSAGVASDRLDGTAKTDGGREIVTVDDDPPVIQNNPAVVNPFEVLTKAVNRPKYFELDPTVLLFLTFPFFFGFMIGDVGYGLLYVLIGYWVYDNFDAEAVSNFGMVVVWLGLWTIIFGVVYGELFGHYIFQWLWEPILGAGEYQLFDKGIVTTEWAITWLIVACVFGWIQLNIAYVFNFIEEFQLHGPKPAVIESGSWLLMLNGLWVWIFSTHLSGSKPAFLVGEAAVVPETLGIGFYGFPELVGIAGLVAFVIGLALILSGPWYEAFEFLVPVVHVLSYTRLTAVLLSKAGMAVAANLLYFGAVLDEGASFDFLHATDPDAIPEEAIFGGLANMGSVHVELAGVNLALEGALLGLPVLIVGHLIVLAIGGTAALQAIRLEYVEFFGKFYEGGGKNYQPFGYDRRYTTDT